MAYLSLFACLMYSMNAFLADISGDIRFMSPSDVSLPILTALKRLGEQ